MAQNLDVQILLVGKSICICSRCVHKCCVILELTPFLLYCLVANSMFIITSDGKLFTIEINPSNPKKTEFDTKLGSILTSYLTKAGDYLFVQKQGSYDSIDLWVSHLESAFRKALFPSAYYVTNQTYYVTSVHNRQLLVLVSNCELITI